MDAPTTPSMAIDFEPAGLQRVKAAAELLRAVSDKTSQSGYLRPIAGTAALLVDIALYRMCARTRKRASAWSSKSGSSSAPSQTSAPHSTEIYPPALLDNIAFFSDTLNKLLAFVRRQVGGKSLIKRVVGRLDDASQLADTQKALDHAVHLFKMQAEVNTFSALEYMNDQGVEYANLLAARLSSSTLYSNSSRASSGLSLLPGSPKVFHGRDLELEQIVTCILTKAKARIAILGPGGVGKSSLALAALYDARVVHRFGSGRHFVSCEAGDIVSALGNHLGVALAKGRSAVDVVLGWLEKGGQCVLVLDNVETAWEPSESRQGVEDLLSRLSGLPNLHLIITLRGEERPAKVSWTRPFLRPLQPLSDDAARQTFLDITDVPTSELPQVNTLLRLTDNLPLAITLLASLASFEGVPSVLERWESERISLLTEGTDKSSNLLTSIELSISSPRLRAIPEALLLLRILAVLPDGATEHTFASMGGPLATMNIALCRITLCRTSLAYTDQSTGRIKVLVPIREHLLAAYPAPAALLRPVEDFFYSHVEIFCTRWAKVSVADSSSPQLIKRVSSDLGNIYSLLRLAVAKERVLSRESIQCILNLARFTRTTFLGSWALLRSIEGRVVEGWEVEDPGLVGDYFAALSNVYYDTGDVPAEEYLEKAIKYFEAADDPDRQANAYFELALYHMITCREAKLALRDCLRALSLARKSQSDVTQARVLYRLSGVYHNIGDLPRAWRATLSALAHAQAAGDLELEFRCLLNRASHFITAGNYPRAIDMCDEMREIVRGLGNEDGKHGLTLRSMRAEVYLRKTEWAEAREANLIQLEMMQAVVGGSAGGGERKDMANMPYILLNMLECDLGLGAPIEMAQVDEVRRVCTTTHSLQICALFEADLRQERFGELDATRGMYRAVLDEVRGADAELTSHCFQKLGENAALRGEVEEAMGFYTLQFALSWRMPDFLNIHYALRGLGDVFRLQGDLETARNLFTVALEGFTLMDVHRARDECVERLRG
ncbi:AAA domain-containing protein [Mycena kentingensis (nom. inval.)]|nr:AAA domain-containing protein [Mycena kentingensis (nom. inval.)]